MVMEAPPSPQSVGREFVRQYYTLLNKAPTHLHRFYNHQSSFIHGGLDPPNRETSPVIGQKQIHQKIQQLNFRDCHAKITQVDSQATLGNGVVVQVTGELSNAGQPMRRFTQTFVLAAQSPKKYYVHNDIFRYQDEIISDEECEPDAHSEEEEEVVILNSQQVMPPEVQLSMTQPAAIPPYYSPNAPAQIQDAIPPVPLHHNPQLPPHVLNAQPPVASVNGAIHPEDINVIPVVPSQVPPTPSQPGLGSPMTSIQQGLVQPPLHKPPTPFEDQPPIQLQDEPIEEQMDNSYTENQDIIEPDQCIQSEPASNEPKTYANLLKSGSNIIPYGNSPTSQPVLGGTLPSVQPRPPSPTGGAGNQGFGGGRLGNTANSNLNNRGSGVGGGNTGGPGSGGGGVRMNQQQPGRLPNRPDTVRSSISGGRNPISEDGGTWEDKRRPQGQGFNDVNQLFLGNLPHTATEDELREIFSEFGAIVLLRVHSKTVNKIGGPPGARAPPNYGFITYETQEGVQTCLQSKPIYYPKGDKTGTILNVEEKKVKDRSSFGGGRPLTENNRGGRGDNGGPRRGGPGGMGSGGPGGGSNSRISTGGPGGASGPNNRSNTYSNRGSGPPNRGQNTFNNRR